MFKVAAIAAFGLSLIVCAGNASAVDMAMPTGDFAHGGSGSGSGETETATAASRAAGSTSAMHETAARDADTAIARDRMQPDSAAGTDNVHAARGTDVASSSAGTPALKTHHNGHWQSLLPGVMK
jgi:hypothetical protein